MAASLAAKAPGNQKFFGVLIPFVLLASVWLVMEGTGIHAKMVQAGSSAMDSALNFSSRSPGLRGRALSSNFQKQEQGSTDGGTVGTITRIVTQLIYGAIYYCLVVKNYQTLDELGNVDTSRASAIQQKSECSAMCSASCSNILLSWCCTGPRAAHTFHAVGVLNYWISLLAMSCCPCIVLCVANAFTDLNEKLGGEKRDICSACLCAFCCSCCVVAQDAEALDLITEQHVGLCGVTQGGAAE